MDLQRDILARIDRKVVSGRGHDESYRTVRVPVSEALWSTWKRYSDAAGISMGRAIVDLIGSELHAVIARSTDSEHPVFADVVGELQTLEQRIRASAALGARSSESASKVGRNERCPCNRASNTSTATAHPAGRAPLLPDKGLGCRLLTRYAPCRSFPGVGMWTDCLRRRLPLIVGRLASCQTRTPLRSRSG